MEFKDYYQTLGVPRDAPADAIKKAYRGLARKYHPDVSKEPNAGERMAAINEAHTVLSDPEKRAAYDQFGQHPPGQEFRPPPGWDANREFSEREFSGADGAGFSDFFSEIFGRSHGAGGARGGMHGGSSDHHARIELDLEDAFTAPQRQIALQAPKVDAQGRVSFETRTLNVKIPRGIRAGQVIRLAGQGTALDGGKPGDLLLEVQFRPHPRLRADGRDLYLTLPLAPWEAALGGAVPVELPGGAIEIRIPAGAQAGKQLRVRGKGLPSEPPGDLFIELRVLAPPATTPKAKELYEALAKETGFDARKEAP